MITYHISCVQSFYWLGYVHQITNCSLAVGAVAAGLGDEMKDMYSQCIKYAPIHTYVQLYTQYMYYNNVIH